MPAPTADHAHTADNDVLAREQAHLEHARDQLRRMRESADRLDASTAADAFNAAYLDLVLARRVASLQDDPRTTLFFGRIDTRTDHGEETFHIGRGTSPTTAATPWSSTGGHRSRRPSTARPPPSRWASSCAAASA